MTRPILHGLPMQLPAVQSKQPLLQEYQADLEHSEEALMHGTKQGRCKQRA